MANNTQPKKWKKTEFSKGFLVHEIINPNNDSNGIRKYFYKNKPAYRITLNSKLAQQLAGYALIEKDLRSTIIWLETIEKMQEGIKIVKGGSISNDREKFNVIKGLYVASLIFYGKCFTKCEGRNAQLSHKNVDEKFIKLHMEIMKQRHNFAAHSGAEKIESVKVSLVFPQQRNAHHIFDIFTELDQPDVFNLIEDLKFIELVRHQYDIARKKINELRQLIIERDLKEKNIDEWIRLGKKSLKKF
ncbi:hypothetical protein [Acinetobacter pittii]|uniref:Uncharacterized protein n=1 Tax=Acinetobacter pittii ANC 4050 TaxID=1217691 RepID=R8YP64_ACIPI|nr:hypothetical protein [Acinetobacter pittii]EOQ71210.1 hypothetical protein F931_00269 [Acinetobacter pittii ANC 4050]MCG9513852.1 hypothetical protein [Acinetobacter pittii]